MYMRNYLMLAAWLVISPCYAQTPAEGSVLSKYEQALDELVQSRDEAVGQAEKTAESITLHGDGKAEVCFANGVAITVPLP